MRAKHLFSVACLMVLFFSNAGICSPPPVKSSGIEAGKWLPLFPSAKEDIRPEKWLDGERVTNIFTPRIQFFFPEKWKPSDQRPLICVFPGGGYGLEAIKKEGTDIAKWLNSMGIVAAVIKYRVSSDDLLTGKFPGPLLDARKALRMARSQAGELGIHPQKIGVIGFSAGGHLAGMAATLWNKNLTEDQNDPLANVSARPDFAMLIYPVISMNDQLTHHGSKAVIAGPNPSEELLCICSPEKQVTEKTPPIFLVHAKDDQISFLNSQLMEESCRQNKVPVMLMLYETGGHGYGIQQLGKSTDAWPNDARKWLESLDLIPTLKK